MVHAFWKRGRGTKAILCIYIYNTLKLSILSKYTGLHCSASNVKVIYLIHILNFCAKIGSNLSAFSFLFVLLLLLLVFLFACLCVCVGFFYPVYSTDCKIKKVFILAVMIIRIF